MRKACPLCGESGGISLRKPFLVCRNCELVWNTDPTVTRYVQPSEDTKCIDSKLEEFQNLTRMDMQMILSRTSLSSKKKVKILDIGCGSQALLLCHLAKNLCGEFVGADYVTSKAISQAKRNGVRLVDLTYDNFAWTKETNNCDLIICSHVFEHLVQLRQFVDQLRESIGKATFFGAVPMFSNSEWSVLELMDNPEHIQSFHEKTIRILAKILNRRLETLIVRVPFDCFFQLEGGVK